MNAELNRKVTTFLLYFRRLRKMKPKFVQQYLTYCVSIIAGGRRGQLALIKIFLVTVDEKL